MAQVVEKYSELYFNQSVNMSSDTASNDQKNGQSFIGMGAYLTSVKFYLKKGQGSPTGNATASLFAHSGTFGSSSVGTGSALATSDNFDVSTLTGYTLVTLTFSTPYFMDLGTPYVIVLEYSGGDNSNSISFGYRFNTGVHAGNRVRYQNSAWIASGSDDAIFYLYGEFYDLKTQSIYLKQGFQ